jgi:hypothetical protein
MRRALVIRLVSLWLAFSLGAVLAGWFVSRNAAACDAKIMDLDVDGLTSAAQAALPAAVTGSGMVTFNIDVTGVRVHADSLFENQSYDSRVLAVVRGSPVTLEISTKLLRRMLGR